MDRLGLPSMGKGTRGYTKLWTAINKDRLGSGAKSAFHDMVEAVRIGFAGFSLAPQSHWYPGKWPDKETGVSSFGFHLKVASSSFVTVLIDPHDSKHPIVGFEQT